MITNPLRKNSSWACLHYGPTRLRKSLRRSLPRWFHTLSNQTEPSQKVREILYERPNRYVGDEKMDNPPCHLLSNSPYSHIKIDPSLLHRWARTGRWGSSSDWQGACICIHKTLPSNANIPQTSTQAIPAFERQGMEDQKFEVIFRYTVTSRPAWAAETLPC